MIVVQGRAIDFSIRRKRREDRLALLTTSSKFESEISDHILLRSCFFVLFAMRENIFRSIYHRVDFGFRDPRINVVNKSKSFYRKKIWVFILSSSCSKNSKIQRPWWPSFFLHVIFVYENFHKQEFLISRFTEFLRPSWGSIRENKHSKRGEIGRDVCDVEELGKCITSISESNTSSLRKNTLQMRRM